MGKNKAEPLECSRLPYRFPALMTIFRELDLRRWLSGRFQTEGKSRIGSTHLVLGGCETNPARRHRRGSLFLYLCWRYIKKSNHLHL